MVIMNKIFNKIFLYLCVALFCASCDNDGDTVYVEEGEKKNPRSQMDKPAAPRKPSKVSSFFRSWDTLKRLLPTSAIGSMEGFSSSSLLFA